MSVQGSNGATGNYSFVVMPTTLTSLPLNGSINGTLAGSGQAELFSIDVPTVQTLSVSLQDLSNIDSNELYLKFGSPPTRESLRLSLCQCQRRRSEHSGSQRGDRDVVRVAVRRECARCRVRSVLPQAARVNAWFRLDPRGSGQCRAGNARVSPAPAFEPGTKVTLIGPGNTQYPAASDQRDFLHAAHRDVRRRTAAGRVYESTSRRAATPILSTMPLRSQPAARAHLETDLQVPAHLGRHIAATHVTSPMPTTARWQCPRRCCSSARPIRRRNRC